MPSKGNLTLQELGIALLPIPDSEWDGASGRLSAFVQLLSPDNRFKRYFTETAFLKADRVSLPLPDRALMLPFSQATELSAIQTRALDLSAQLAIAT